MEKQKRDTRCAGTARSHGGDHCRPGEHAARHDPTAHHQGDHHPYPGHPGRHPDGPLAGGILGGVFGICSMVSNTVAPVITSFAFSPFLSTTGLAGAVKAIWICLGCRILIGVVAGWLWVGLRRVHLPEMAALPIVGFVGSMVNTVCVMGSIYLLFAQQYAEAQNVGMTAVFGLIMGTVVGVRHSGGDCSGGAGCRDWQGALRCVPPCRRTCSVLTFEIHRKAARIPGQLFCTPDI